MNDYEKRKAHREAERLRAAEWQAEMDKAARSGSRYAISQGLDSRELAEEAASEMAVAIAENVALNRRERQARQIGRKVMMDKVYGLTLTAGEWSHRLDRQRKHGENMLPSVTVPDDRDDILGVLDSEYRVEMDMALYDAVEADPDGAAVFYLVVEDGMSVNKASDILGISRATAYRRLEAFKSRLSREFCD